MSTMKDNGKMDLDMVLECTYGKMAIYISVNGIKTKGKGWENLIGKMEKSILESGKMIKDMVKALKLMVKE